MILQKVKSRLQRYRRQGFIRTARIAVDHAGLEALRLVFGFASWHAVSPISARPYRKGLAALCDELKPRCVVEVGCGLGGIITGIDAEERYGYDIDAGVIRGARFLHPRSAQFRVGGFEEVDQANIDILIAICWVHEYSPEQLERWFTPLLPRTRYLLIDTIDLASPLEYNYYHDYAFLEGKARLMREEKFEEAYRRFLLYEVRQ